MPKNPKPNTFVHNCTNHCNNYNNKPFNFTTQNPTKHDMKQHHKPQLPKTCHFQDQHEYLQRTKLTNDLHESEKTQKPNHKTNKHKLPEFKRCSCSICQKNYARDCKYCLDIDDDSETSSEINESFAFQEGLFHENECALHNPNYFHDKRRFFASNGSSCCKFCSSGDYHPDCFLHADSNPEDSFLKSYISGLVPGRSSKYCVPIPATNSHVTVNRSFPTVSLDVQPAIRHKPCEFCVENGQPAAICNSHQLRNESGGITCPIFKKRACYTCPTFDYYPNGFGLHPNYSEFYPEFAPRTNILNSSMLASHQLENEFLNRGSGYHTFPNIEAKSRVCDYCLSVGQPAYIYTSHSLRDDNGLGINCPIFKQRIDYADYTVCNKCGDFTEFSGVPSRSRLCSSYFN